LKFLNFEQSYHNTISPFSSTFRFKPLFQLQFDPLEKEDLLKLIKEQDQVKYNLICESDLIDVIPEKITFPYDEERNSVSYNLCLTLVNPISTINNLTKREGTITLFEYDLPLFLENESLYRAYLQIKNDCIGKQTNGKNNVDFYFHCKNNTNELLTHFMFPEDKYLLKLVRSTGNKNISGLLEELHFFKNKINSKNEDTTESLTFLSDQLQKNHPELFYTEEYNGARKCQ